MKFKHLPLLLVLSLTGCMLGPDYQRPGNLVPNAYRGAGTDTGLDSFGNVAWWELYRDPQLQELIRSALANSKDAQAALARVAEARQNYVIARAPLFPQLNGSGAATRTRASKLTTTEIPAPLVVVLPGADLGGSSGGSEHLLKQLESPEPNLYSNLYTAGIDFSYELDLWGKLRRAREAARAELLAAEASREAVAISLISEVARNYFTLRELDLELEISTRTLQTRLDNVRLVTDRKELGVVSALDLRRAEAEAAATSAALPRINQRILQTENALAVLTGRYPDEIARGLELQAQPIPPQIPIGLPVELLTRRPDVMAAEQQLIALNAQIGEAKAGMFPSLTLTGLLGLASPELEDFIDSEAKTWQIGAGLAQPIFQGGSLLANLRRSRARQEQGLYNYEQSVLQALQEVSDSLAARGHAAAQQRAVTQQVDALRSAAELAQLRYEGGKTSYLELLDAQRELFSAELTLAQTRLDEHLSYIALYKALGGGWNAPKTVEVEMQKP